MDNTELTLISPRITEINFSLICIKVQSTMLRNLCLLVPCMAVKLSISEFHSHFEVCRKNEIRRQQDRLYVYRSYFSV